MTGAQCSRLRLSMLGGIRWFRYNDYLEYAASDTDTVFGTGADDVYYRNTLRNDLVGFQLVVWPITAWVEESISMLRAKQVFSAIA